MTLLETITLIQKKESEFMGQALGNSGHIINGFEVFKNQSGEIEANLLGFDPRSGVAVIKKNLLEWCKEKGIEF